MPRSAISCVKIDAIWLSFCGILNTHFRFSSIGATIDAAAASVTIGVALSDTTSNIANADDVKLGPIKISTLSSLISFLAFRTAIPGSLASSRMMYSIGCPAMFFGHSNTAFFEAAPIAAAGPVIDKSTPTLIWANTGAQNSAATNKQTARRVSMYPPTGARLIQ